LGKGEYIFPRQQHLTYASIDTGPAKDKILFSFVEIKSGRWGKHGISLPRLVTLLG